MNYTIIMTNLLCIHNKFIFSNYRALMIIVYYLYLNNLLINNQYATILFLLIKT